MTPFFDRDHHALREPACIRVAKQFLSSRGRDAKVQSSMGNSMPPERRTESLQIHGGSGLIAASMSREAEWILNCRMN